MKAWPLWMANTVLVGVLAALAARPVPVPDYRVEPREATADPLPEMPSALPFEAFAVIAERPLFTPERRPPTPPPPTAPKTAEPPAPPPPPPEPPGGRLHGVIGDAGGWMALYQRNDTEAIERLRTGQQLEGWRVTRIEPAEMVLEREGRTHTVPLRPKP